MAWDQATEVTPTKPLLPRPTLVRRIAKYSYMPQPAWHVTPPNETVIQHRKLHAECSDRSCETWVLPSQALQLASQDTAVASPRPSTRKQVQTPPVASPLRSAGLSARDSREEDLEAFDELCQDAAARELAHLIVGPPEIQPLEGVDEPCQRARTVAHLLLAGSSGKSQNWQPPHLCRLFSLRRARRRVRAVRQVKTVLALRAELLMQTVYSAWRGHAQLSRHVQHSQLCATGSHVMIRGRADGVPRQHADSAPQLSAVTISREELRHTRRASIRGLVSRGEAAFRLVLLFSSLHAWSEHCRRRRDRSGVSAGREMASTTGVRQAQDTSTCRLARSTLLGRIFPAWAYASARSARRTAENRMAQDTAAYMQLQLCHDLQLQRLAQWFRHRRLGSTTFRRWHQAVSNPAGRCVSASSMRSAARITGPCFAAWRLQMEGLLMKRQMAAAWHKRATRVRHPDMLKSILVAWSQLPKEPLREPEADEAARAASRRGAAMLSLGRRLLETALREARERPLSDSDSVFQSMSEACDASFLEDPGIERFNPFGVDACGRTLSLSSDSSHEEKLR
eukprot:s13_g6.t1